MATTLKGTIWGGVTFSASPAMAKPQIFIAKGSDPWYNDENWNSMYDVVTNVDESVSGQATVTCKDVDDMMYMFYECYKLTSIDLSRFDTSKVVDMSYMFEDCYGLTELDLSNFDTSKVKNMWGMFDRCYSLTELDLSNFDTSKVKNMDNMFYSCFNLTTIKGIIDMKSCEHYKDMFKGCSGLTGVKIKNPPAGFNGAGLSSSQYTIVS